MTDPLRIAIAGLGTVGGGVVRLLETEAGLIAARAGRPLSLVAVSARDRARDRGFDAGKYHWFDDPLDMVRKDLADVYVELIGGTEAPARPFVQGALAAGKNVVTANKALLAHHGQVLAELAESHGAILAFEAAVAGGIPIIKGLREGLAADRATELHGILNGTCNYILSRMRAEGLDYADVLADAQQAGYAEADPTLDVEGVDAAHKLALLTAIAFGCAVDFDAMHVEGISRIGALDVAYAGELGYRIKLLGIARRQKKGIEQRVHPCLVPADSFTAAVEGVFNAVVVEAQPVNRVAFVGRGAGAGPTASAVLADLIDIAAGRQAPTFGLPAKDLLHLDTLPIGDRQGSAYLRLMVRDRPGVLAEVAAILRDHAISIESLLQRAREPDAVVPVVMVTHDALDRNLSAALAAIGKLDSVTEPPVMIRIEKF